jgi:hypothetical protein
MFAAKSQIFYGKVSYKFKIGEIILDRVFSRLSALSGLCAACEGIICN